MDVSAGMVAAAAIIAQATKASDVIVRVTPLVCLRIVVLNDEPLGVKSTGGFSAPFICTSPAIARWLSSPNPICLSTSPRAAKWWNRKRFGFPTEPPRKLGPKSGPSVLRVRCTQPALGLAVEAIIRGYF